MRLLLVLLCLTVGSLADIVINVEQVVEGNACDGRAACRNDGADSVEVPATDAKKDGEQDEKAATVAEEDGESNVTTTEAGTTTTSPGPCGSDYYLADENKCLRFLENYNNAWVSGASRCSETDRAHDGFFVPSPTFNPNVLKGMFANAPSNEYFVGRFKVDASFTEYKYYPDQLPTEGEPECSVYKKRNGDVVEELSSCYDPKPYLCTGHL